MISTNPDLHERLQDFLAYVRTSESLTRQAHRTAELHGFEYNERVTSFEDYMWLCVKWDVTALRKRMEQHYQRWCQ